MKANEHQLSILIKAWETMQALAKGNGEAAWHIRTWAVTAWSAMMAYAYQNKSPETMYIAIVAVIVLLFIEAAVRQIQYKFIEKSMEVESSLKSILEGGEIELPDNGISTKIGTPTISDFISLFQLKRWMFWFPYLILAISSWVALKALGSP